MKKTNLLLVAGLAVFALTSSQAFAFSIEEDMTEDIVLSVQKDETNYKYDNTNANSKESLTEFVFFPASQPDTQKYVGDPTCPSGDHLMAEDSCLESATYLAGE
ncbi:MAG: hypothetical protein KJ804_01250 [Proteobacteria bacterium]|nr:hypothetical protein [Pseudomonadota bacterium]MBU1056936.1 hypothetical protein [Pseudomonadota bacterium]